MLSVQRLLETSKNFADLKHRLRNTMNINVQFYVYLRSFTNYNYELLK